MKSAPQAVGVGEDASGLTTDVEFLDKPVGRVADVEFLDEPRKPKVNPLAQPTPELAAPQGLSLEGDVQRRRREKQNRLIKQLAIVVVGLFALAAFGIWGAGYTQNLLAARELAAQWDTAKQSIDEHINNGQFRSAESGINAFERTVDQSTVSGAAVVRIKNELQKSQQKIAVSRNEVKDRLASSLAAAIESREMGRLDRAESHLRDARSILNSTQEKDAGMKASEVQWVSENFRILAAPFQMYSQTTRHSEQAMMSFAAGLNVTDAYDHLAEHPDLNEKHPDEALIVTVMYHWGQLNQVNEHNKASEWEQSIRVLRTIRNQAMDRPAIDHRWPRLIITIDQTLTLTIYDRIDTSRAHINQLTSLNRLPEAVLACKDLIRFVNDLENVMRTIKHENFTNKKARDKAVGFKSYARRLIVDLEWQILGLLVQTVNIVDEDYDELLEKFMTTDPDEFNQRAKQYFGRIKPGIENLHSEMDQLNAIEKDERYHDIRQALTRYHRAWEKLVNNSNAYTANLGSAKAFDQFVDAARETTTANNNLKRHLKSLMPEEPEN